MIRVADTLFLFRTVSPYDGGNFFSFSMNKLTRIRGQMFKASQRSLRQTLCRFLSSENPMNPGPAKMLPTAMAANGAASR